MFHAFNHGGRVADLPTAYPLRDLFDTAVRGRSIKLTCRRCGHVSVLNAHALWWLFHRNGWSDRLADVQKRCTCMICWYRLKEKVRRPSLELVHDEPTETRLPMPSELDWKRELRRRR